MCWLCASISQMWSLHWMPWNLPQLLGRNINYFPLVHNTVLDMGATEKTSSCQQHHTVVLDMGGTEKTSWCQQHHTAVLDMGGTEKTSQCQQLQTCWNLWPHMSATLCQGLVSFTLQKLFIFREQRKNKKQKLIPTTAGRPLLTLLFIIVSEDLMKDFFCFVGNMSIF